LKDARLVARGFSQQYGNEEIFLPVAKMTTVRVLISLAARFLSFLHGLWILKQNMHDTPLLKK
jgi:hypothetical protein